MLIRWNRLEDFSNVCIFYKNRYNLQNKVHMAINLESFIQPLPDYLKSCNCFSYSNLKEYEYNCLVNDC